MPARIGRFLTRMLRIDNLTEGALLRFGWAVSVIVPIGIMFVIAVTAWNDRVAMIEGYESDRARDAERMVRVEKMFSHLDGLANTIIDISVKAEIQRQEILRQAEKAAKEATKTNVNAAAEKAAEEKGVE